MYMYCNFPFETAIKKLFSVGGVHRGSYRSWKTWKVNEFYNLNHFPCLESHGI